MKKPYILKRWPEQIDADPEVIARLTKFLDWQLSIEGEMYKALNAAMEGKHQQEVRDGIGDVAEQGSGSISSGDCQSTDANEASGQGLHEPIL